MDVFEIYNKAMQLLLWVFTYPIEISGFSFRVLDCVIFFGIIGIVLYAVLALLDRD